MRVLLNRELACKLESDIREGNKQLVEAWNASDFSTTVSALELDNALAVYGGSECPINEAVGLGMSSPVEESVLEEIERFYHLNNHPAVIRVCPLADDSLIELTKQRGYVLNGFSHRWVLDLSSWQSPFVSPDSRVRVASSNEEMDWSNAIASGFADVDEVSGESLDLERAFFRMKNTVPVLAIENGVIASGGVLAMDKEIAALFGTSTLPSYRRRGLQTALLDWRLRCAKEHGVHIATIETDPASDSQRNVERMGFRLAYTVAELIKKIL